MDEAMKDKIATQEETTPAEEVRTWQRHLVQRVLWALAIIGPLAAGAGSYYDYARGEFSTIPIYWTAYAVILVLTFWRRVPYTLQAGVVMALIYGLALLDFPADGRGGSGRVFLLVLPFMAGLFFGVRESIVALALVVLTMAGYGWAFSTGVIVATQEVNSAEPTGWISNTFVLVMLGTFIIIAHNSVVPRLVAALTQSYHLTRELKKKQANLEAEVEERTADLSRRARYLEATALIARDTAAIMDLGQLLTQATMRISEQFGFYHSGIFLLDEAGEYAVLQAASSQGGQRMLARGHRLRVGQEGIVGYVTGRGEPRFALDVGADAVHFDNLDLPETRSEMALPLRARGEIIGALDVQSNEPGAFSQEDLAVLQTLADQVAMAISNARLFQQAQASLEAERRAYGEVSRQAWAELLRSQKNPGFLSNQEGVFSLDDRCWPEMETALRTGEAALGENGATSLAMPLKVRGQVIGVVDGRKPGGSGEWTPEEIELLQTLAEQVGLALESARLYQDTQRRAVREQMLNTMTARFARSLDLEAILQTAVQELGQSLPVCEVSILVGAPDDTGPDAAGAASPAGRLTHSRER